MNKSGLLIKSFSLLKKFRNISPFFIEFKPLTVIVGENGSGKSSFLNLLINEEVREYIKIDYKPNTLFKFFDTEKQNPRIKSYCENSKTLEFDLMSRFLSHGETMLPIIAELKKVKNKVIIIDEPEAGLSLSNQKNLLNIFDKSIKNGCQVIIATHSYVIIKKTDTVFNMNNKSWQPSNLFLKNI